MKHQRYPADICSCSDICCGGGILMNALCFVLACFSETNKYKMNTRISFRFNIMNSKPCNFLIFWIAASRFSAISIILNTFVRSRAGIKFENWPWLIECWGEPFSEDLDSFIVEIAFGSWSFITNCLFLSNFISWRLKFSLKRAIYEVGYLNSLCRLRKRIVYRYFDF